MIYSTLTTVLLLPVKGVDINLDPKLLHHHVLHSVIDALFKATIAAVVNPQHQSPQMLQHARRPKPHGHEKEAKVELQIRQSTVPATPRPGMDIAAGFNFTQGRGCVLSHNVDAIDGTAIDLVVGSHNVQIAANEQKLLYHWNNRVEAG